MPPDMGGFTKLFSSIVTSSIWVEDDATLRVWIAMLATADALGLVEGTIPGFANLARVTTDQMRTALQILSSPDSESRTPDHEGRRIEAIQGGWLILNYADYRTRGQAKDGSRAPYMRVYRTPKTQNVTRNTEAVTDVTRNTEAVTDVTRNTEAEAEAEAEAGNTQEPRARARVGVNVEPQEPEESDVPFTPPYLPPAPPGDLGRRAAEFLQRYQALHVKYRHGAPYHGPPTLDFKKAEALCQTYADERLDRIAIVFLTTDHDWISNNPRTIGRLAHMASWCDGLLREKGL